MAYKTLIFDLDGTLLDTSEGILATIKEVFLKKDIPLLPDETMKTFIGPPIEHTFGKLFNYDEKTIKGLANEFRDAYFERHLYEAKIFDGIPELLIACKERGVKTAVATNKRENQTFVLLKKVGLFDLFDVVHGTDKEGKLKKCDVIKNCLLDLEADERSSLMVGDAWSDEVGAKLANVDFAAAMYGFGFNEESAIECVFKCYSPLELTNLL